MATTYAEAVRAGTMAATRLHVRLKTRERIEARGAAVDVFGAALDIQLPMLFRPLKGLLGAYLRLPTPGALVTTARSSSIQRFTGAHELGHHCLGHEPSLDDDGILRRISFNGIAGERNLQEVEANAFAASFLMPKWLVQSHCFRQQWTIDRLAEPLVVYQLSLRLGQSYEAVTWTLERHRMIASGLGAVLRSTQPRSIKQQLLASYRPADFRSDVWLLTERDEGTYIDGSRSDHVILRLSEHSGGGYLWSVEDLRKSGFVLLRDETSQQRADLVGDMVRREVVTTTNEPHRGRVALAETRPWEEREPLNRVNFQFDLTGPEQAGYSRAERYRALGSDQ